MAFAGGCGGGGEGGSAITPYGPALLTQIQFDSRHDLPVGETATQVAAGDIDGDGRADLVVTRYTEGKVTYFQSLGNANYATGVDLPFGPLSPFALALGDLDNDGKLDAVVTDYAGPDVYVFRNHGGGFDPPTSVETSAGPVAAAIADLDGDGLADVAVACMTLGEIVYHRNAGAATLGPGYSYMIYGKPVQLALADLNADGRVDIACTDTANGSLRIYRNDPDVNYPGFATTEWPSGATDPHPVGIAIANLDADPAPEIVTGSAATNDLIVWKFDGSTLTKHFVVAGETPCGSIAIADFDGDGKLDVAAALYFADGVATWPGIGDGTFTIPALRAIGIAPIFVAAGDTTGDGRPDLLVADTGTGEVCTFPGQETTDGNIVSGPPAAYGALRTQLFAVGDLDGDGRDDLAVADNSGNDVNVLRNEGSFRFLKVATLTVPGTSSNEPILLDLDEDGDLDLVQLHNAGATVFRNLGNNVFDVIANKTEPGGYFMGAAGDFFQSGNADLVLTSFGSGTITTFANVQGGFSLFASYASGSETTSVAPGDFDLDGDIDFATVNYGEESMTITARVGIDFAQGYQHYGTEDRPTYVRAADVDRDGRNDLIVGHYGGSDVLTYFAGPGNLLFSSIPVSTPTNGRPMGVRVADIDLNGNPDLLYCEADTGKSAIRLVQPDGKFGPVTATFPSQYLVTAPIFADLDGDGLPDLLTVANSGSLVNLQRNLSQ